jgi:hypothetical protein
MQQLQSLARSFSADESGFVITAELVLISSLLVIGLMVGMTAVQSAVVGELEDVGSAIGSLNQTYYYHGMVAPSTLGDCGIKSYTAGSAFHDLRDECDAGSTCLALQCASSLPPAESSPKKE